jgi:hypothetical protein
VRRQSESGNASNLENEQEDTPVKCDLCDKEFSNSEELMRHKEQMHPMDQGEMPDNAPEKREMPDSEPAEMPSERRR